MRYDYLCEKCGEFEVEHTIHEKLVMCPECEGEVERLISAPAHVYVDPGITTVGKLAEVNTKKLGRYGKPEQKKSDPHKERQKKISKMTPAQKEKYIHHGEI